MKTIDEETKREFVTWQCLDCGTYVEYDKAFLPEGDLCPNCHYEERNRRTVGLAITRDGDVKTRKLEPWLDYLRYEDA